MKRNKVAMTTPIELVEIRAELIKVDEFLYLTSNGYCC